MIGCDPPPSPRCALNGLALPPLPLTPSHPPYPTPSADYERVQVFGGRLWFMQKNEGANSQMFRLTTPPTLAVAKPNALFAQTGGAAFNWNDFDLVEPTPGETVVWAVSASGLLRYAVDTTTGAWVQTFFGGPTDLISVGVSNDKTTVYCVVANNTYSGVFSWDVGTSTWNNNGAAILTPPANRQFRGIGPAPIIPPSRTSTATPSITPSNTPSTSVSPSNSPTGSETPSGTPPATASATATLSAGALPSATGSPSSTATGTPTPTSSLTARGGRVLPSDGFAVVLIGNGTLPIPNRAREVLARATVNVYASCASGCGAAALDRSITLPHRAFGDEYGNRAATLTTGSTGGRATFLTGRLVPSEDRAQLTLGLFDVYEGYVFGSKREPIVFTLAFSGFWRTFMPCAVRRTASSGLIDDPFYCNGFNHAEPAFSVASDSEGNYYITAADVAGSTYGVKHFNESTAPLRGPANVGMQDRNDYMRVQVFQGKFYVLASTAFGGNGAVYRVDRAPRPESTLARPSLPLFAGPTDTWQDMDVASHNEVWVGGRTGLWRFAFNGSAWLSTSWTAVTEIVGVAVSGDLSTVYVSTASDTASAVYAFDTDTQSYNNGGAPILTPPAGFQFRGVAAAPVQASASPVPTSTRTSSATPTGSASPSASVTASASSTQSVGETSTSTITASPVPTTSATETATATQTRTPTGTNTGTRTGTSTRSQSLSPAGTPSGTSAATGSRTGSPEPTGTATGTRSPTGSRTATPSASATGTGSASASASETASVSASGSGTGSTSPSATGTPSVSATETGTPSSSATESGTPSPSGSGTGSVTAAATGTATASRSAAVSPTKTRVPLASTTASRTRVRGAHARARACTPSRTHAGMRWLATARSACASRACTPRPDRPLPPKPRPPRTDLLLCCRPGRAPRRPAAPRPAPGPR